MRGDLAVLVLELDRLQRGRYAIAEGAISPDGPWFDEDGVVAWGMWAQAGKVRSSEVRDG
jgi:hypothetical protein